VQIVRLHTLFCRIQGEPSDSGRRARQALRGFPVYVAAGRFPWLALQRSHAP